jgi:hypothetical protein
MALEPYHPLRSRLRRAGNYDSSIWQYFMVDDYWLHRTNGYAEHFGMEPPVFVYHFYGSPGPWV